MNEHDFTFAGTRLTALPSGALWHAGVRLLCVSDLHLGKSERIARRGGALLPPYETVATLDKLAEDIAATDPRTVVCLGDSFDDLDAAEGLQDDAVQRLTRLQAGRRWIWIAGNHDAGPVGLGGTHLGQFAAGTLTFRHIAAQAEAEVSGHYHPKFSLPGSGGGRPCFLYDARRLILPAYGAYTGGLHALDPALRGLFGVPLMAVLTGRRAIPVPVSAPGLPRARMR